MINEVGYGCCPTRSILLEVERIILRVAVEFSKGEVTSGAAEWCLELCSEYRIPHGILERRNCYMVL